MGVRIVNVKTHSGKITAVEVNSCGFRIFEECVGGVTSFGQSVKENDFLPENDGVVSVCVSFAFRNIVFVIRSEVDVIGETGAFNIDRWSFAVTIRMRGVSQTETLDTQRILRASTSLAVGVFSTEAGSSGWVFGTSTLGTIRISFAKTVLAGRVSGTGTSSTIGIY